MAQTTGFEAQQQGGRKRRRERKSFTVLFLLAGALLVTWILSALGVTDSGDANLRRLYYLMRGERQAPHDVLFVAIDETTVDAWGPPPWHWNRYGEMVAAIEKGRPRLIAFLEPGPRLMPDELPIALADLQKGIKEGRVIAPSAKPGFGQPQLALGPKGVVEAVALGNEQDLGGPSVTREVVTRAGFHYEGDTLPVNYYGGPDSLPTVPAHRIATGEIPQKTFADRIVVVGLRGERFAPIVPTPVGAMSPSEVHAHALLGLANRATWAPLPGITSFLVAALLALACAGLLHRLPTGIGFSVVSGIGLATVVADYWLFRTGTVLLGATVPLVAGYTAATGAWLVERSRAHHELEELTRFIAQRLSEQARKRRGHTSDDEFWEKFAEAARIYLEFDSTIFGELRPGDWHLHFRTFVQTAPDDIFERRRDIRRDPYKRSYLSHKPMWTNRQFMAPEKHVRSLMVPLVAFNRAFGFWVINFPEEAEVSRAQLEIVEQLADQIAMAIERRRLEDLMAGERTVERLPAEGQLVAHIKEMREAAFSMMQEQQSLAMLFDRLPVGVMVATLWGEVQFANESVRRFFRLFDNLANQDVQKYSLAPLIAELTGGSDKVIHEMLRELVNDGNPVRLSGRVSPTLGPAVEYEIVVSRLGQGLAAPEGDAGLRLLSDFVMTVTERVEKRADVTDWTMKVKGATQKIGNLVDVRVMLRELVADVQSERGHASGPVRPIMVEVPDSLPAIRVDDELPQALRKLLREATQAGGDEPLRIVVAADRKELVMHIVDPQAVLPRKELDAVEEAARGDAAGDDIDLPEHLQAFVAAKRSIEAAGIGQMAISSGLEDGTTLSIHMPRRRRA